MDSDFEIGERVSWMAVNGRETGEITEFFERGIVIQLKNGKAVLADEKSLIKEDK